MVVTSSSALQDLLECKFLLLRIMLLLHGASFCKYDQEFLLLESRSIAWLASSFENMEIPANVMQ
jgi:hypothetical protein